MSIKALPLMIFALIIYNAIVFFGSGTPEEIFYGRAVLEPGMAEPVIRGAELFRLPMPNGGNWSFRLGDLVMLLGIVLLGLEVIKATFTRGAGLADQALSIIVFVIFLVEFLLVPQCASSLFFLLTCLAAVDVIAGAIIGIRTARRDFGIGSDIS